MPDRPTQPALPGPPGRHAASLTRSLFPACVATAEARAETWEGPLHPEEERFVQRAVARRRREFGAGRACARAALRALGLEAGAIPVGPDRAPVWPAGVVGSITHTRGFCAAAVARRRDLGGVGVDAERRGAVGPELVPRVCTPAEIRWMQAAASRSARDWATLVFSAKEAAYKALHARLGGRILGFHDAVLPEPPRGGEFCVSVVAEGLPPAVPARLRGRFRLSGRHVLTAVVLPTRGGD